MRFFKIISASVTLGLLLGSAYSASALEASSKHKDHSHQGYYKPGAAVSITSDYDGETQAGELENITLKIEHYYSEGYLSARLLETPDLQIMSHQTLSNEKLSAGSNLNLPLQLSGTQTGEHFISLEVIHESLSGNRSLRVLSLPIQIGHFEKSKTKNTSSQKIKSDTEKGLIILTAKETIR